MSGQTNGGEDDNETTSDTVSNLIMQKPDALSCVATLWSYSESVGNAHKSVFGNIHNTDQCIILSKLDTEVNTSLFSTHIIGRTMVTPCIEYMMR